MSGADAPRDGERHCRTASHSRTQLSVGTQRQVLYPATPTAPRGSRLVERVSLGTGVCPASLVRLGVPTDVPLRPLGTSLGFTAVLVFMSGLLRTLAGPSSRSPQPPGTGSLLSSARALLGGADLGGVSPGRGKRGDA
jgi:hypothetical protein